MATADGLGLTPGPGEARPERRPPALTLRPDGTVPLAEPDPTWPQVYAALAAGVRAALGDLVLRLEHVGSTSVPGLVAKPVIDLLLVLADPADEPAWVPALERAGWALALREPDWYAHRLLRPTSGPLANLHVHPPCPEVDRVLAFRDRLRTDAADRELYASVKRGLAARSWPTVQAYADAKSEVVAEVLSRALAAPPGWT